MTEWSLVLITSRHKKHGINDKMAITFSDLAKNLEELRVVNMMQRRKIARRMKRLAKSSAFRKKKERAMLRIASPAKIRIKAQKMAKKKIVNKFYPNYKQLSPMAKIKVDQKIAAKYGGAISKIAKRSLVKVKKAELVKVKKARAARAKKKDEKVGKI